MAFSTLGVVENDLVESATCMTAPLEEAVTFPSWGLLRKNLSKAQHGGGRVSVDASGFFI